MSVFIHCCRKGLVGEREEIFLHCGQAKGKFHMDFNADP